MKLARQLAEKLPLLEDILSSSEPSDDGHPCGHDQTVHTHGEGGGDRALMHGGLKGGSQKEGKEIPLRLPGSVWALVSLVLVVGGHVDLWKWLGDTRADPSLAQQTLEVCHSHVGIF